MDLWGRILRGRGWVVNQQGKFIIAHRSTIGCKSWLRLQQQRSRLDLLYALHFADAGDFAQVLDKACKVAKVDGLNDKVHMDEAVDSGRSGD